MFPPAYWQSYERAVSSLHDYLEAILAISKFEAGAQARFAWRGVPDCDWALYSSLVRAYLDRFGAFPTELELRRFERSVLLEAKQWTLDWHAGGGRLSALELLAALQHYGVPSRLLDFSFNPVIALWFAVEKHDDREGRVFAVNIAGRQIRSGTVARANPFWMTEPAGTTGDWSTRPWVWSPPPLEPRMTRQEACFVMGGIPSTFPARNVRTAGGGWRLLKADEVRACMSFPFQLIGYERAEAFAEGKPERGRPPKASAFTLRVKNKVAVRKELQQVFGYSHRSLFPDFPGFREYGRSWR